ncbi:hypothetical protein DENIT_90307 [Pseudomonas veronii]|nr:hypothetical protein DENIT_90307 [Pseudomonas veronii]
MRFSRSVVRRYLKVRKMGPARLTHRMMGNVQVEHRIVDGVEVYRLPPHAPDVSAKHVLYLHGGACICPL